MMPLTMMHGKPRCSPGYEWMQLAIYGNQGVGRVDWKVGVRGQGCFPWLPKAASERKRRPHDDGTERKRKWKCANAIVTEEHKHTLTRKHCSG